ncbi:hypothetical protein AGLY_016360, partial [Aphis glycines]
MPFVVINGFDFSYGGAIGPCTGFLCVIGLVGIKAAQTTASHEWRDDRMHVHLIPGSRVIAIGQSEVSAHNKRLDAGIARATRLGDDYVAEEYLKLGNEQGGIFAAEYLPNERAARLDGQQQLCLHILVQIVEPGDVRRAVEHDQVHQLSLVELGKYLFGGTLLGDVALQLHDAGERGHRLKVDRDDLHVILTTTVRHLAPASGGRAQVHHSTNAVQHFELSVDLDQFERASSPPALFLGQPVPTCTEIIDNIRNSCPRVTIIYGSNNNDNIDNEIKNLLNFIYLKITLFLILFLFIDSKLQTYFNTGCNLAIVELNCKQELSLL